MSKIISVIPNICEGRDVKFINNLTEKLQNISGLIVLDVSMDKVRNRTVYALSGTKQAIFEGGRLLYKEALNKIDMDTHEGQFPRIGAVDVFPFVPLKDVTIEEAIEMADEFAELIADEFKIPVYLFSESARHPMRRQVEKVRENEYEGLDKQLLDPEWKPDYGPDIKKPCFGATIIGARYAIVSFKMYFNTTDSHIIKDIADSIQYSTGGLRNTYASFSGIIKDRNLAQVFVRVTNYKITPMYKVLEMARMEAKRYGISLVNVEMVGLIPEKVFLDAAMYYMNIRDFSYELISEKNIQKHLDENLFFIN